MEVLMIKLTAVLYFLLIFTPTAHGFWFFLPDHNSNLQLFNNIGQNALGNQHYLPQKINILVWNIYKGKKKNFKKEFKIYKNNNHILMIQEAVSSGASGDFIKYPTSHNFAFAVSFIYRYSKKETGVATGATTKALNHYSFIAPYRELVGSSPKVALVSLFEYHPQKPPLMTVNVHALNSVTKKMFSRQMDQLASIINNHRGPVVFAGDFNTWSKRKTRYLKKLIKSIHLKEVKLKDSTKRMKVFGNYLDYIFVKNLRVNFAKVNAASRGSDHKPLSMTVTLP